MTSATDMKLLKVISLLMDYPEHELFIDDNLDQCKQLVMQSRLISPEVRQDIATLIDQMAALGELEAQAKYDSLFERGRSLSLWLFEHVHGESRDRGQAMVDLTIYRCIWNFYPTKPPSTMMRCRFVKKLPILATLLPYWRLA